MMKNFFKTHVYDFILIVVLTLISVSSIFILFSNNDKHIANIYHESELLNSIDLNKENEEREVSLPSYNMTLIVKHDYIKVKESSCPNQTCVHQGFISSGSIICAYNKILIKIEDSNYDLEVL